MPAVEARDQGSACSALTSHVAQLLAAVRELSNVVLAHGQAQSPVEVAAELGAECDLWHAAELDGPHLVIRHAGRAANPGCSSICQAAQFPTG